MKRIIIVLIVFAASGVGVTIPSYGNNTGEGFKLLLPKKLHRALTGEMNALQNAMSNLSIAIPAGRLQEVAETAEKMKEGYIMKKVLSKKQLQELNKSLPSGYHTMDRAFYKAIENLKQAAQGNNREKVTLYYYKSIEKCVTCHARYAGQRFPDFRN
jgi:hypothetical protein